LDTDIKSQVTTDFQTRFGAPPEIIVRAPARVNLIGEHTDYNDGFVLPMAIDRAVWIALRPRRDRRVLLHSLAFPQPADFPLDDIQHSDDWTEYVRGVAWVLGQRGLPLRGWEGVLASDVPIGAGLSSSAALEMALLRAFCALSGWAWDGVAMARLARQADREWVGIQSGIMDQMIAALGQKGHALLIDCRSLEFESVPLPAGTCVLVLDTATRRGLVDSAYNERVTQCRAAARHFDVPALRDITPEDFHTRGAGLEAVIRRRARHVITENQRTLQAVEAMRRGDAARLGALMNASHESLREDYEVSSRELDLMVELARQQSDCYGARMTGAGFGGCAIALMKSEHAPTAAQRIASAYQQATGLKPEVYICTASARAHAQSM